MTERELLAFEPAPAPLLVLPAPAALSPEKRQWWRQWAERHIRTYESTVRGHERIIANPDIQEWVKTSVRSTMGQYRAKILMFRQYIETIKQYEGSE